MSYNYTAVDGTVRNSDTGAIVSNPTSVGVIGGGSSTPAPTYTAPTPTYSTPTTSSSSGQMTPAQQVAAGYKYNIYTGQPLSTTSTVSTTSTTPQYNLGTSNLSVGSKGEEVKQLLTALNRAIGLNLKTEGIYGAATKAAVEAYQSTNNLKVDGIVGSQTIGSLNKTGVGLNPTTQAIEESLNSDPEVLKLRELVKTIPELQSALDILTLQVTSSLENGQVVNPDLTITPELTAKFLEQATAKLDPYYKEIIQRNKEDLTTSFRQLQEDYNTAITREQPAFQNQLESADINEANAGMAFSSGRVKREGDLITNENQKLQDLFQTNQRSAEQTATNAERKLGSREFSSLGIPSLQQYATQSRTIAPSGKIASTGSRNLYSPIGNLTGDINFERRTALDVETSNLQNQEIKRRILDAGGLGMTSLG